MVQPNAFESLSSQSGQCSLTIPETGKLLTIDWKKSSSKDVIRYRKGKVNETEMITGTFFYENQRLKMNRISKSIYWEHNGTASKRENKQDNVSSLPCTTLVEAILNEKISSRNFRKDERSNTWEFFYSDRYSDSPSSDSNYHFVCVYSIEITYTFDFNNLTCTYDYTDSVDNTP